MQCNVFLRYRDLAACRCASSSSGLRKTSPNGSYESRAIAITLNALLVPMLAMTGAVESWTQIDQGLRVGIPC